MVSWLTIAGEHCTKYTRSTLLQRSRMQFVHSRTPNDVRRVTIDPSLLGEDKDMLEDLVAAALNDAVRKVEAASQEKMAGLTAGLPLPPGFKLPF